MSSSNLFHKSRHSRGVVVGLTGRRQVPGQAFKRACWKGASVRQTKTTLFRELARSIERNSLSARRDSLPHPQYGEVRHGRGA